MSKTLFITGATDGIGLLTAQKLVKQGHLVCLHGRNPEKLEQVFLSLSKIGRVEKYQADLSDLLAVKKLLNTLKNQHSSLDALINNAGVLKTPTPIIQGLDQRFVVNTLAPYLLTQGLMPLMSKGRVINVASAAQAPISLPALEGKLTLQDDMEAYSQSKLALILWTFTLAASHKSPNLIAVNPGSLLASKMVKEGFGIEGKDLNIGADILIKLALSEEYSNVSGQYFDNDLGDFTSPHPETFDIKKGEKMIAIFHSIIESIEKREYL